METPTTRQSGLPRTGFKTLAESRLRAARLYDDSVRAVPNAYLYVSVNVVKSAVSWPSAPARHASNL